MSAPGVVVRGWYRTDDGYADNDSFEHRFLEVCMTTLTIEAPVGLQASRSALNYKRLWDVAPVRASTRRL
jgi:hypothetical protein